MSFEVGGAQALSRGELLNELGKHGADDIMLDGTRAGDYRTDVVEREEPLGAPVIVRTRVDKGVYRGGINVRESIIEADIAVVRAARERGRTVVSAAGSIFFK